MDISDMEWLELQARVILLAAKIQVFAKGLAALWRIDQERQKMVEEMLQKLFGPDGE